MGSGIPVTKKKLAELELSLLHLQQNIEIPQLSLTLHPAIQAAVDEATAKGTRVTLDLIPSHLLQDTPFLNSLQSCVNAWIKSIQSITRMSRDAESGTATQEINFWLSMEEALAGIEEQLRGDGVQLTLEVLKHAKRFLATVSFITDTNLKEANDLVQKYNQLMREFPLDELLSATSLTKVQDAVLQIFNHLNKKLKICPYPIRRALPLVEAISADLDSQIHSLLSGRKLMHLEYRDFENLMAVAEGIFRAWDDSIKEFTGVAREVARKRSEKFIPIKINARHAKTQERLAYIKAFRHGHEQLQRTIQSVLVPQQGEKGNLLTQGETGTLVDDIGDGNAVEEVSQAFAVLRDVDVLDVSPEGTEIWISAENAYNERTSRVENSIIARLRDRLATAKTANEMFRVFSKFNALFVRPKIRGAIQEYQNQLIESVKLDIAALHERFKQQYGHSEAHAMAQLHDLPPISGAIIWARQIERQLQAYMKRVEDVLGKGWEMYHEGQKLQAESNAFRKKLETKPIFDSWLNDVNRRNISISGRLFNITRNRAAGNTLELVVNFDPQVIALFKEVRNLLWLNFQVPHVISNISKEAKRVYPYAVSLMETVRTFLQTNKVIMEMSDVSILLSGYQNDVHALIIKGVPLKWESFVHSYDLHLRQVQYNGMPNGGTMEVPNPSLAGRESRHVQFVRDFASAVSVLQDKASTLAKLNEDTEKALKDLQACPYEATVFRHKLHQIQDAVDKLNLGSYVNLGHWVEELNGKVEAILLMRLNDAIQLWIQEFNSERAQGADADSYRKRFSRIEGADQVNGKEEKAVPSMKRLIHEMSIRNQVIYLDPPMEYARASWFAELHAWIGIVCDLPKLRAGRYDMRIGFEEVELEQLFSDLVSPVARCLMMSANEGSPRLVPIRSQKHTGPFLQSSPSSTSTLTNGSASSPFGIFNLSKFTTFSATILPNGSRFYRRFARLVLPSTPPRRNAPSATSPSTTSRFRQRLMPSMISGNTRFCLSLRASLEIG